MIIAQLQGKLFGLPVCKEGSTIIFGVPVNGTMIEMCEHPLPVAAMVIIVTYGLEDEAVVGIVNVVLVVRLSLKQGIASMLGIALKAESTICEQAVKPLKLKKRRVGMLLNHCLDIVERSADFAIASAARGECKENERK